MRVELVVPPNTSKPNSKMFPVLVFLLMACYGIMALVVVEQGSVIQSQRNLIAQLFSDSAQLTSLKGQEATQRMIEKQQAAKGKHCRTCTAAPQVAQPQSAQPQTGKESQTDQMHKTLGEKSMISSSGSAKTTAKVMRPKAKLEKQPLQTVDKPDRRRFPSQI